MTAPTETMRCNPELKQGLLAFSVLLLLSLCSALQQWQERELALHYFSQDVQSAYDVEAVNTAASYKIGDGNSEGVSKLSTGVVDETHMLTPVMQGGTDKSTGEATPGIQKTNPYNACTTREWQSPDQSAGMVPISIE